MKDLGDWSDAHLEPPNEKVVGFDWKGNELYGHEHGYFIDGDFICEDDIIEYIERDYSLVISGDVMDDIWG